MQIKYSCSEYTHICMQQQIWLCLCFRQGQLCCKPAAASCCWLHQSILVRTKVNMRSSARRVIALASVVPISLMSLKLHSYTNKLQQQIVFFGGNIFTGLIMFRHTIFFWMNEVLGLLMAVEVPGGGLGGLWVYKDKNFWQVITLITCQNLGRIYSLHPIEEAHVTINICVYCFYNNSLKSSMYNYLLYSSDINQLIHNMVCGLLSWWVQASSDILTPAGLLLVNLCCARKLGTL